MLQWEWKHKVGEAEIFNFDKVVTYNLYKGNAFLIMIYEYEENGKNMYSMHSFFVDEAHAKRCFGIDKKDERTYGKNCFNEPKYKMQKLRIKKSEYGTQNTKKLVNMLVEAFNDISIEIY